MINIALKQWFFLLWENPFVVLISNLTIPLLLGVAFGFVALIPLPQVFLIFLGVYLLIMAILYLGGLGQTTHLISQQRSWSLGTPWKLIPTSFGTTLVYFFIGLLLLMMWFVSIPSYLSTPDAFAPSNPQVLSVIKEGGRYRINWRDPPDPDLGAIHLEITIFPAPDQQAQKFRGRIDPGWGTYLVPEFEGRAEFLLKASDDAGNLSEGVNIQLENDAWAASDMWTGQHQTQPRLLVSGLTTNGLNLSWEKDIEGNLLDKGGEFRVVAADTQDGLPQGYLETPPTTFVLMDWTKGVLRRSFDSVGFQRALWYQVYARWPSGVITKSEPIYVQTLGMPNLIIAGILIILFIWLLISLPFWIPWKHQQNEGFLASFRHSQVFVARNLFFAAWVNFFSLVWIVLSALLLTSFPGILGVNLWYEECLRLQLKAEKWLKEHGRTIEGKIPWHQIFSEERQLWANRKLKQWFMPWR